MRIEQFSRFIRKFDLSIYEFRHIIGFKAPAIIARVFLREKERLVRSSLRIEMSYIQMSISTVLPAASPDSPSAVGRPAVVTVGLIVFGSKLGRMAALAEKKCRGDR